MIRWARGRGGSLLGVRRRDGLGIIVAPASMIPGVGSRDFVGWWAVHVPAQHRTAYARTRLGALALAVRS